MKKAKNRYRIIMTGDMICLSLIVLVPLLIMLLGSFKNETEAQLFNLKLPTEWVFDNYSYVIIHGGIARAFLNSIIITVSVVVIVLISGSICAFVVSRRQNRYTKFVYSLFLAGMVAPLQIVTTFGLLKVLNLSGTYLGVILVTSAVQMPWAIFTLYGFIKSVPRELDEAAIIDGASPLRIFSRLYCRC